MFSYLTWTAALTMNQTGPAEEIFFEAKIRPVLVAACFKCHGEAKASSGLRVDSREGLLKGGERGPAVVPGQPDKSWLLKAVRYSHHKVRMPPDKKLPAHVVVDLTRWIQHGAVWPKTQVSKPNNTLLHWAFQPVKNPPLPPDATGWAKHPIDRFIRAKLREKGLSPVGQADKRTLLRRATFDLLGLPPTPEEMDAGVNGNAPDAFTKVVARLLASPHYGERWGRHWMDVVRYADTAGDNADYPIPEIHRYRDYIIDAFNADTPFDQFVREQLAGDLMVGRISNPSGKAGGRIENPSSSKGGRIENPSSKIIATGFLALSRRYATAPYEFWHLSLEDAIDTTGAAFLGLTLRCARCHDHKFDPITKEDYYGLYGIFAATVFPYAGSEEFASQKIPRQNFVPLGPQAEAKMAAYRQRLKQLEGEMQKLEKESPLAKQLSELNASLAEVQKQIQAGAKIKQDRVALQKSLAALILQRDQVAKQLQDKLNPVRTEQRLLQRLGLPPDVPGAYAVQDGKPSSVRIHLQGDPDKPGPVAPRQVPKFIEGKPVSFPLDASGRLELAQWITRPDHPLTARVIVNRVWQYHFGRGLVATPNNFGVRGEPPTHPELLDHLAGAFVRHGWSIKWLHRYIMQSKTYQLAGTPTAELLAQDPDNRWLGRFSRRRLDAEALRDALLAVSGRLDRRRPGPHPFPPITTWGWTQHNPFKDVYPSNHRSVYLMTQRIQRHPILALFDGPDTNTSTEKRQSSLVPLQALFFMNHPFVKEQAEGFARRLLASGLDPDRRIALAHQLAWGRSARKEEIQKALAYLQRYTEELRRAGAPSGMVELEAWTSFARILLTANEFLFVD